MAGKKALRAIINGVVQGVNFRMATTRAANQLGVFGWVRNKPDGSVEAFIEGDEEKVDEMVSWCHKGPPLASVKGVTLIEETYSGAYTDFTVR